MFTHQYQGMNALHTKYKDAGFHLIAVPCNQFGHQEPGDNGTEILNSLKYVRPGDGFVPNFPLTEKVEVNGENEHPLYTYLKTACPTPPERKLISPFLYSPIYTEDIRWNFEKFLIGRDGRPVYRYISGINPWDPLVEADIETELSKEAPVSEDTKDEESSKSVEEDESVTPIVAHLDIPTDDHHVESPEEEEEEE